MTTVHVRRYINTRRKHSLELGFDSKHYITLQFVKCVFITLNPIFARQRY